MFRATSRNPRWGFFGHTNFRREGDRLIVGFSRQTAQTLGVSRGHTKTITGPPVRVYSYLTISDEDRDRLEREIGHPFVRRD